MSSDTGAQLQISSLVLPVSGWLVKGNGQNLRSERSVEALIIRLENQSGQLLHAISKRSLDADYFGFVDVLLFGCNKRLLVLDNMSVYYRKIQAFAQRFAPRASISMLLSRTAR